MTLFYRCTTFFLFTVFLISTSFAQQSATTSAWSAKAPPTSATTETATTSKVVLIDSRTFYDEKTGIQKLVSAYKQLEREFSAKQIELQTMEKKLRSIADDISKMSTASPEAVAAKREEGERLQREYEFRQTEAKAAFAKREKEIITPVFAQIGTAMEEFMKARGITFILDASKMGEALLAALPTADVTQAFVAEYNAKNPGISNTASR